MRGPNKIVRVSVSWTGVLTPLRLQSIAAKLASPPLQILSRQVRKNRLQTFRLDLGDGLIVDHPGKRDELQINL